MLLKHIILCLFLLGTPFTLVQSDEWKRVYLATFPRAGNHWLRDMIEESTYIATSSVYIDNNVDANDVKHLETPFPWGGYSAPFGCNGNCRYPTQNDIVVIKTHYPSFSAVHFDFQPSIKTIRIIRHPIDSFYSFYILGKKENDSTRIPQELLLKLINAWRTFQEYWDKQENVITIRYEDLYKDTYSVLKKTLSDIGYVLQDKDIERAVIKHPRRGSLFKHVSSFNQEDKILVETQLNDLLKKYNYQNL